MAIKKYIILLSLNNVKKNKSASPVRDRLRSHCNAKSRNETKEKSVNYKCMFVNGRVMQLYILYMYWCMVPSNVRSII